MRYLSRILILALTFMFASKSYGESYACSHELSRSDRPSEVETNVYTRKGNIFENNKGWVLKIINDSVLFLTLIGDLDPGGLLVHIDKNSKEFGELFYAMDEFRYIHRVTLFKLMENAKTN